MTGEEVQAYYDGVRKEGESSQASQATDQGASAPDQSQSASSPAIDSPPANGRAASTVDSPKPLAQNPSQDAPETPAGSPGDNAPPDPDVYFQEKLKTISGGRFSSSDSLQSFQQDYDALSEKYKNLEADSTKVKLPTFKNEQAKEIFAILQGDTDNVQRSLEEYNFVKNLNPSQASKKDLLFADFYLSNADMSLEEAKVLFEEEEYPTRYGDVEESRVASVRMDTASRQAQRKIADKQKYFQDQVTDLDKTLNNAPSGNTASPSQSPADQQQAQKAQQEQAKYEQQVQQRLASFSSMSLKASEKEDNSQVNLSWQDSPATKEQIVRATARPIEFMREYILEDFVDDEGNIRQQELAETMAAFINRKTLYKEIFAKGIAAERQRTILEKNNTGGTAAQALKSQQSVGAVPSSFEEQAVRAIREARR